MDVTTIKIYKSTKERLNKLRTYKRESYEEIVEKLLDILNMCRGDPLKAQSALLALERKKAKDTFKEKQAERQIARQSARQRSL